jgi:hypothetical protein
VSWRWVWAYDMFVNSDKSLVSDLSRGRGKPIDGDLDVDEEDSKQNDRNLAVTTLRLRWLLICAHMN